MDDVEYSEFAAVERPLTPHQVRQVRALSAAARVTATSFVTAAPWGDVSADARSTVGQFYDAHVYLASWDTRHLMLRVPASALDEVTAARYCAGEVTRAWSSSDHTVLSLAVDPDIGGEDLIEDEMLDSWGESRSGAAGEGWLAAMLPARVQLVRGDHRVLYLAWLLAVQRGCVDDDEVEPPVPLGLGDLPDCLRAVVGFFGLGPELLAVAAASGGVGSGRRTVGRLLGAEARLRAEGGARVGRWGDQRVGSQRRRRSALRLPAGTLGAVAVP